MFLTAFKKKDQNTLFCCDSFFEKSLAESFPELEIKSFHNYLHEKFIDFVGRELKKDPSLTSDKESYLEENITIVKFIHESLLDPKLFSINLREKDDDFIYFDICFQKSYMYFFRELFKYDIKKEQVINNSDIFKDLPLFALAFIKLKGEKLHIDEKLEEMKKISEFCSQAKTRVRIHTKDKKQYSMKVFRFSSEPKDSVLWEGKDGKIGVCADGVDSWSYEEFIPIIDIEKITYKGKKHIVNKRPFALDFLK